MERRYRTGDQSWVREHNLAVLLHYLWEAGSPISRTRLVELSGFNKSTVGSLLAELQSWRFVRENGVTDPRPGRPGALVEINPDGGRIVGAEIGVDFVSVVLTDLRAQVVWSCKVETDGQVPAGVQADVLEQAENLVQMAFDRARGYRLLGIGLGVPGLVDRASGTLLFAPNLGWRDVSLRGPWRARFGVPVIVENEANAAALGERMLGVARQTEDFVYLSAGVGLGGGVMIDGKLYGGAGGFAGEVGHMTLERNGPLCNCGNRGCWETLVGPTAIVRRVQEAARAGRTPLLLALPDVAGDSEALHMRHVLEAAALGEAEVLEVLDDVGHYLGIGIASLVNIFNPSLVVLGGALSLAGPYMLPSVEREVANRSLESARRIVRIALSAFKFDACVIGSTTLILREILSNPTRAHATRIEAKEGSL